MSSQMLQTTPHIVGLTLKIHGDNTHWLTKQQTHSPSVHGILSTGHVDKVHVVLKGSCHKQQPSDPSGATRPPRSASSTNLEGSHHQTLENAPSAKYSGQDLQARIFNTLQSFIQCHERIFEVLFPKCSSCLALSPTMLSSRSGS